MAYLRWKRYHTARKGDDYASIAEKRMGSRAYASFLARSNRGITPRPGTVLKIPRRPKGRGRGGGGGRGGRAYDYESTRGRYDLGQAALSRSLAGEYQRQVRQYAKWKYNDRGLLRRRFREGELGARYGATDIQRAATAPTAQTTRMQAAGGPGGWLRDEYGRLFSANMPHHELVFSGIRRGEFPTYIYDTDQIALGLSDDMMRRMGYHWDSINRIWIRGEPQQTSADLLPEEQLPPALGEYGGGGWGGGGGRGGGGGGGGGGAYPTGAPRYPSERLTFGGPTETPYASTWSPRVSATGRSYTPMFPAVYWRL